MGCRACESEACPFPPLPWKQTTGKGLGICDDSVLRQCDVAWPSVTVNLTAGAPQIAMAWSVTNVGFKDLQPIALKFSVTPEDGLDREEIDRLVGMSQLNYENTNFLPQTEAPITPQPISHFGPYCTYALRITELGIISSGNNAPVATMDLLAGTYAGTLRVTGTIFGRSVRGGMVDSNGYQSTP